MNLLLVGTAASSGSFMSSSLGDDALVGGVLLFVGVALLIFAFSLAPEGAVKLR